MTAAILVIIVACTIFWLVFLKLKLLRLTPGWGIIFAFFVLHLFLVFLIGLRFMTPNGQAECPGAGALDTCMRDEDHARAQLASRWEQFGQGDTKHCIQLSNWKGFQSYVELLTCLEMAAEAKTLPKGITQQ